MLTVETKVARWRTLYGEMCEAEQRLRQAQDGERSAGATIAQLEGEVRALQRRCDDALDEVGTALAATRPAASTSEPASASRPA